jgi:hypothetical protein
MDFQDLLVPGWAAAVAALSVLAVAKVIGRPVDKNSIEVDIAVVLGAVAGLVTWSYTDHYWLA